MAEYGAKQIFNKCPINNQYNYCENIITKNEDKLPIRFNIQDYIPSFTGRTLDLEQLDESVSNNQISIICGFGGIGKTELVRYYAWENRDKFDGNLIWINAETHETINSLYKSLALDLSVSLMKDGIDRLMDSIVRDIYNKFNKKRCLLIFDNAINQTIIRGFLPRRVETNINVIITSQNREWTHYRIDLNVLTPEESEQFFLKTLNIDLRNNIEILAEKLQYLPIALQQAATYINFRIELRENFGVLQYIEEFEKKRLFTVPLSENFDYNKTVYTTVSLTVDLIKQTSKHPKLTLDILDVCSYLAPDNIPKSIFLQLSENADVLNEAFHVLIKYSLLREFSNDKLCYNYNIHRLVQLSYRYIKNPEGFSKTTIRKSLRLTTNEEMKRSPHSYSVLSFIMQDPEIDYEFYFIDCSNQKILLFHLGLFDYFDGIKYLLKIIKVDDISMGVVGAIEKGSLRIVKYMCELHPKLFDSKKYYLFKSAEYGKINLMKYFINKGAVANNLDMEFNTLHIAAVNGHLQLIQYLYDTGLDLNDRTHEGCQAIHLAVHNGHLEIVKFLIENGSQVDTVSNNGQTPLLEGAFNGHLEIVNYLLNNNSNFDHVNNDGFSGLLAATYSGHFDIVKQLIKVNCNIHQSDKLGFNALHLAAQNGHLQIIKFLLETGFNLNNRTPGGSQAIHLAAGNGHLEIVKFLLENESQVDTVDNNGQTPLFLAAFNGHQEVVNYLLDNDSNLNHVDNQGSSVLFIAAYNGHFDVVKQLIKSNCNIHQSDKLGFNALHLAAQNGHLQIIKFLCVTGLDLNDRTQKGSQAIHLAAHNGHLEIVKFLLENGSQIDTVNNDGRTPLFLAAFNGHLEVVNYLLDNDSNLDHVNNEGFSGLLVAAYNGHFDVVTQLIKAKCNIHQICKLGVNALHIAALNGHLQIVKFLYETGLDLNEKAQNGCQAIHLAAGKGHLEIVKFLLENGSQVDTVNNNGETPVELATSNGHQEVVKYLVNLRKRNASSLQCKII